jgi:hypothetical protein
MWQLNRHDMSPCCQELKGASELNQHKILRWTMVSGAETHQSRQLWAWLGTDQLTAAVVPKFLG